MICSRIVGQSIEVDFPVEAVIKMALAGYLDGEAIGFVDFKPNRGHKSFTCAWLDLYQPSDVRIAIERLDRWEKPGLLLELEAILLRATEPPYNVKIPIER
jgi:hypothetical protein